MEQLFCHYNFEFYSWKSISYVLLHKKLLHRTVAYRILFLLLHLQSADGSAGIAMKAGSLSLLVSLFISGSFIAQWSESTRRIRAEVARSLKPWNTHSVTFATVYWSNQIMRPAWIQGDREIGSSSQWEELQIPWRGAWVQGSEICWGHYYNHLTQEGGKKEWV